MTNVRSFIYITADRTDQAKTAPHDSVEQAREYVDMELPKHRVDDRTVKVWAEVEIGTETVLYADLSYEGVVEWMKAEDDR